MDEKTWVKVKDQRIVERYNRNKGYIVNEETGMYHSNPTEEQFIECGYRELVPIADEDRLPEKEGYYIDTVYEDTGTQAIEKQIYVEIPDPEPEPEEYIPEDEIVEPEEDAE